MAQTGVVSWSQTAASNATADSNVNWAEGMAPSQVNDSARAMMASVAKYRDDISGFNFAGGSGSTYTYSSQQGFGSLAAMNGQTLTIFFNFTNVANPTLNVDSLGAKLITLTDNGDGLPAGFIQASTTHQVVYDNGSGNFYIVHNSTQSFIPPGTIWAFGGTSTPTGWKACDGSAISRTTFANLFTAIGVLWGIGDGSTTFNIPDLRGRTLVGFDSGAIRLSGAASVGAVGGAQSVTLTTGQIPQLSLSGASIGGSQTFSNVLTSSGGQNVGSAASPAVNVPGSITVNGSNFSISGGTVGNASPGTVSVVQPSAAVNYIIKT